jgi:hypothetical protein
MMNFLTFVIWILMILRLKNYVDFQQGKKDPIIKGRIAAHADFWESWVPLIGFWSF